MYTSHILSLIQYPRILPKIHNFVLNFNIDQIVTLLQLQVKSTELRLLPEEIYMMYIINSNYEFILSKSFINKEDEITRFSSKHNTKKNHTNQNLIKIIGIKNTELEYVNFLIHIDQANYIAISKSLSLIQLRLNYYKFPFTYKIAEVNTNFNLVDTTKYENHCTELLS